MQIDTALPLRLPWPSELQMAPAGPFLRFFALLLDHGVLMLIFLAVSVMALLLRIRLPDETTGGLILFIYAVVVFTVYNGFFFLSEWLLHGRTPGKMVVGLRVVRMDGTEPDLAALLLRNLLRPGDMFPFLAGVWVFHLPTYALGGLFSIATSHFRRGGDLAAGTVVVYDRSVFQAWRRGALHDEGSTLNAGERLYALRRPDPSLLEAVDRFMQRREGISAARREEIARQAYSDLKVIFAWSGPDPTPEELIERIHRSCVKGR